MKVKELQEILKSVEPEADVIINLGLAGIYEIVETKFQESDGYGFGTVFLVGAEL